MSLILEAHVLNTQPVDPQSFLLQSEHYSELRFVHSLRNSDLTLIYEPFDIVAHGPQGTQECRPDFIVGDRKTSQAVLVEVTVGKAANYPRKKTQVRLMEAIVDRGGLSLTVPGDNQDHILRVNKFALVEKIGNKNLDQIRDEILSHITIRS